MQSYLSINAKTERQVDLRSRPAAFGVVIFSIFSVKPVRTILFVVLFASAPLFIPRLRNALSFKGQTYRQMLPNPHDLISFKSNRAAASTVGPGLSDSDSSESTAEAPLDFNDACAAQLINDPTHVLDHFYTALARTDKKKEKAITRITHYGDSPITNDGITGTTRRLLQERFGDAGTASF